MIKVINSESDIEIVNDGEGTWAEKRFYVDLDLSELLKREQTDIRNGYRR